jgi:hypothetical protein
MPTATSHVWRPSRARRVVLDGFAPVPRGVIPTVVGSLVWPPKDPGDVLDYELDIEEALLGNPGDSIATIDVVITPDATGDLAMTGTTADGAVAVFWFSAGQAGTTYSVQVSIGTVNGRTLSRVIFLPVQALSSVTLPGPVLTTDTGAVITDQSGNPILTGS